MGYIPLIVYIDGPCIEKMYWERNGIKQGGNIAIILYVANTL